MSFAYFAALEEWRQIAEFPAYEVSTPGRVRSLSREIVRAGRRTRLEGRIIALRRNRRGYWYVNLYAGDGLQNIRSVHRLVALTFIPNPHGKSEVNHEDADKGNNAVWNLTWATRDENQAHAAAGLHIRCKLNAAQIAEIRAIWPTLKAGEKTAFAERFGIGPRQLWKIGTGRAHRHVRSAA